MKKISCSKIDCFTGCPQKFRYKYVDRIKSIIPQDTESLNLGLCFHALLENDLEFDIESSEFGNLLSEKDIMAVEASANFFYHTDRFKELRSYESINEYEISLIYDEELGTYVYTNDKTSQDIVGYIDKVILNDEEGDTLIDYKFVGSMNFAGSYKIGTQGQAYPYWYTLQTGRKVKNVIFILIKKPTIRKKKISVEQLDDEGNKLKDEKGKVIKVSREETEAEFFARVHEWYNTPDSGGEKIQEVVVDFSDHTEIENMVTMINNMIDAGYYYRNLSYCNAYGKECEYNSICQKEESFEVNYLPNQNLDKYK